MRLYGMQRGVTKRPGNETGLQLNEPQMYFVFRANLHVSKRSHAYMSNKDDEHGKRYLLDQHVNSATVSHKNYKFDIYSAQMVKKTVQKSGPLLFLLEQAFSSYSCWCGCGLLVSIMTI